MCAHTRKGVPGWVQAALRVCVRAHVKRRCVYVCVEGYVGGCAHA